MIYVASPLSHDDFAVMFNRYYDVMRYTHYLIKQGKVAFSPVVHCWPMFMTDEEASHDFEYWAGFNIGMMKASCELRVLILDGWLESHGVQAEIRWAKENNLPVVHTALPKELRNENL